MQRDDYRATLIVIFGLAAATLSGFLRQAVIAHQLGAGRAADIYLVAFAVPEFVFTALPIVIGPVFIPLFMQCRQQLGETSAWQFGLRVAGALLAFLLLFTVMAGLGAPLYLHWLAPGFEAKDDAQAIQATYRMLPAFSLLGLATLAAGMLQVYRQFARPAMATAVYNVAFMATLLAIPSAWAVGQAAWGVTVGAAAALLFQLPLLWQHRPRVHAFLRHKEIEEEGKDFPLGLGQVARLVGPLAAGYGVHHVILFVDRAMATELSNGSAAALNYAYHLALVVGQVSGLAISTALFPRLTEQMSRGDLIGARRSLADALQFVWLIALPASVWLITLRTPLIRLLLEHGAFDQAATKAVSAPLVWYTLAVLADALCQPLWRVVYVQRSGWAVLTINGLQTGLRLLANLTLMPMFGYSALALSALIGLTVQALTLGWFVRRRLGRYLPGAWWLNVGRVGLAAIGSTGVMASLAYGLLGSASPVVQLTLAGLTGGLIYLAILWLLGVFNHSQLVISPVRTTK